MKKIISVIRNYDALLGLCSLLLVFGCLVRISGFYSREAPGETVAVVAEEEEGIEVPIIMYHSVLKDSKYWGKYVVSPDTFENDLKYLCDNGYTTIVVQDLLNYVEQGVPLPEKPVMLTFDDGYYNNYLYVYPLLKQYNCRAVISVIGVYSEKFSETEDFSPFYSHLSWDQIREMSQSGLVEIQNHSYDLHKNTAHLGAKKIRGETNAAYSARLSEDVGKLQSLLKEKTGIEPTAFTYPFGAVSDASVQILKQAGFRATLSCEEKVNRITRDPDCLYRLNRFLRPSGKSSDEFFLKILPAKETFLRK